MSVRILIVEDEESLTLLLRYNLEKEGFLVEAVARGDEAEIRLKERTPDLVLLDWMLPGVSGIDLCRRLRARPETQNLPIIMLTARGEEFDRVRGLATGADDYVVKPFSVPELMARVRAALRRANPHTIGPALRAGDLELDRETTPGRVFNREQLLTNVWGEDAYVDERTVDVFVGRLRKALNQGRGPDPIRTVRGFGYAFDECFGYSIQ